jgi:hypothetical protein
VTSGEFMSKIRAREVSQPASGQRDHQIKGRNCSAASLLLISAHNHKRSYLHDWWLSLGRTAIFGKSVMLGEVPDSIPYVQLMSEMIFYYIHTGIKGPVEHTIPTHMKGTHQSCGSGSVCFGPPGSGSFSQRHGSESGSFYYQPKIVRKTLIPTVLWILYDFFNKQDHWRK